MPDRKRVDRVDLGVYGSQKVVDVYAKEFTCMSAGKVAGDLDAEIAEVKGTLKVQGDVRAALLKVGGTMKVMGDIQAELIRAKGAFKVMGSVRVDHFRITGATKVEKDITSNEEISVMGVLKCMSSVKANRFHLLGVADIDGTLEARDFKAELSGKSSIREIHADKVHVLRKESKQKTELIARSITGKEIYLEATVAERVEGENVVIGPGCIIAEVKASSLKVDKKSKVGKQL